ncbi:FHA domain-containing protein [bacterium]|nr:FHA domain-containing protein [bacterium]
MQDVTITFIAGPMKGSDAEFEVGKLLIGRQPGPGGLELRHADQSVSRVHAQLTESEGKITLLNRSPNGTMVAEKLVLDTAALRPGSKVQVGDSHVFEVNWASFTATSQDKGKGEKTQSAVSSGPLASPLVRAVIGVYMAAMIGVVVWLSSSASVGPIIDDWPRLEREYAAYEPVGVPPAVLAQRSMQAQQLVREMRVLRMQRLRGDVKKICREIMSLDEDIESPLFKYGAKCLGSRY